MGYELSKLKEFYLKDESAKVFNLPKDYNLFNNSIFKGNFINKDVKNGFIDEFIVKMKKKLPIVSFL